MEKMESFISIINVVFLLILTIIIIIIIPAIDGIQTSSKILSCDETKHVLYQKITKVTKSFDSIISNKLLTVMFRPRIELKEHFDIFTDITSMEISINDNDVCKKMAITIAYNNLGIYYSILGQDHYIDAVANFDKATKLDPVSIQIYRNLAWLQHAVTVDTDSAKIVYKNVYRLNWLRLVVYSMVNGIEMDYKQLRLQILPYLELRSFEESTTPNAISTINGTMLKVEKNMNHLVIADRIWDMQFLHTGHGSVFLSIHSKDCAILNSNDKDCLLFYENILKPRPNILLSLFEINIGKSSCYDPLLLKESKNLVTSNMPNQDVKKQDAYHMMKYLNLLKFQLIGFYDDRLATEEGGKEKRPIPNIHQRLKWLSNKKQFSGQSLSISMGRLNNINSSLHLDVYPGDTMASIGMMNNMYFIIKHLISNKVHGHFLEAGVWRGGMTIWIKAVLNSMLDFYHVGNNNSDNHDDKSKGHFNNYKVFVADSFGGVPPPRNSSAFSFDSWHHLPKHLYKVQMQHVVSNFEKYFLFSSTSDHDDKNNIFQSDQVEFLPGYFNESLISFDHPLSLLRIDADSYESILDVLNNLYDNVVPGGIIMIDDWHLNGARRAVLEFRLKRGILETLLPVAEDALYGCEERMPHLYHSHPNKPVQGMFFVKRPENERGTNAKEYYSPFLDQLGIELDY